MGKRGIGFLYCGKVSTGGGINRMKQHLAGKKDAIKGCPKVPSDVKYQIEESLKEIATKEKKQESYNVENPYGPPIFEEENRYDDDEVREVPRKTWEKSEGARPSAQTQVGQSNKVKPSIRIGDYFTPRTTPGSQPSIKSAMVGLSNVVHMVTNNGANYVDAGRIMEQHYASISWSPSSAHCLNLVMNDIAKIYHVAEIVSKESRVPKFVYNHCYWWLLMLENFDPIDYESIDKTDFWIVDDEEESFLDHEDIENMFYEQLDPPRIERGRRRPREDDPVEVDDDLDLSSFDHFYIGDNLHDVSIGVGIGCSISDGGTNKDDEE
ncbi:hypothetical protein BUALT_Bualt09G0053600 [Buddleja alternifolia]|uniref:DUF659 domain-containing protein n=1 Tax=Buddleja alternifolia TaxID=168488 RepID=A0AAV6WZI0_9LAMI|nr:hypothetical protein BUALT_Bualt09G0053600 [Buddleja alternifolia]